MAFKASAHVSPFRLPLEMPSRGATWPIRAALTAGPAGGLERGREDSFPWPLRYLLGRERHRRNDCIRRAMKMRQCGGLEGDGNTHNQDDQGGLSDGRGSFKAKPSDEKNQV